MPSTLALVLLNPYMRKAAVLTTLSLLAAFYNIPRQKIIEFIEIHINLVHVLLWITVMA